MGINATDFSKLWLFIAFTSVFLILPLPWVGMIMEPKKEKIEEPHADVSEQ